MLHVALSSRSKNPPPQAATKPPQSIRDIQKAKRPKSFNLMGFISGNRTLLITITVALAAIFVGWIAVTNEWIDFIDFSEVSSSRFPGGSGGRRSSRSRIDVQAVASEVEKTVKSEEAISWGDLFSEQHKSDLLWGTYRPQLYYGMRTRVGHDALLFGMMWYESSAGPFKIQIRHVTKTEDGLDFQWLYHNGRDFGEQYINDTKVGIEFTTSFVKVPGENGGDWAVRIKGRPLSPLEEKAPKVSVMFYVGIENQQQGTISLESEPAPSHKPLTGTVTFGGHTAATGDYSISFHEPKKSNKGTYFSGVAINEVWQIEKHLRLILPKGSRRAQLENIIHPDSNVFVLQKFKTAPFETDITFVSQTKKRFANSGEVANAHLALSRLLDTKIDDSKRDFEQRFEDTFHLKQKGYNADQLQMAKIAFSNLIGGIGFFYGHNRIYLERPQNEPQWGLSAVPHALFTGTPSRSYFPRGFLWDEGFHHLIIGNWDKELSKDMLYHWFSLMNKDGWIPREQILGAEAESRVPPEFIVQYPEHANPPTLYFPLEAMIARGSLSQHDIKFLRGAFQKLSTNMLWYLRSQRGPVRNSFRWRGAHGNHTLPSGLDDYPRAPERSDLEEHVDLLSWIIVSANIMDKIAKSIDVYDVPQFKTIEQELIQTLQERYWNTKINAYCDYDGKKNQYVEHLGYVTLFPLLFGLIPVDSPRLNYTLDLMENESLLKSAFGLRSLARNDDLFGTVDNYWRGPIWVNINYLTLRALNRYYISDGPYAERAKAVYTQIRRNLIGNIYKNWKKNGGDMFENYNAISGNGQGQHPFAGWTSLIVLIMAEMY